MKTCTKCKIEKELTEFSKDKSKKDGLQLVCKTCKKEWENNNKEKRKEFSKKYLEKNKEKIKKYNEEYKLNNKVYCKEYSKNYRENNKEKLKEYYKNNKEKIKEYNENNKEKIKYNRKLYFNNKRKTNSLFKLSTNTRNLIYKAIKKNDYQKNNKTENILGCSYNEFKIHIESQFEFWMNWYNHGLYNGELNYGWDIDHIIPLASANTEEEIIKLNHYTNLRPLCSYTNRYVKKDLLDFF
jgi:hypothetical protein